MAIYQPTNIVPDMRSGIANGVILVEDPTNTTEEYEFSWQMNGNNTPVAIKIDFYQNNAASTFVFTTGKLSFATTPYPTLEYSEGRVMYRPTLGYLLANLSYDTEYKLKITQWWGATDADSVAQISPSVFKIVKGISATMQTPATTHPTPDGGFICDIDKTNQPETSLEWINWRLYRQDAQDTDETDRVLVYDNGIEYSPVIDAGNTARLSFFYYGMTDQQWYCVKFRGMTGYGQELESEYVFQTAFTAAEAPGTLTASCDLQKQAVRLDIAFGEAMAFTAEGAYSVSDGALRLEGGASITVTPDTAFASPWAVFWQGTLQWEDAVLFSAQRSGSAVSVNYNAETKLLSCSVSGLAPTFTIYGGASLSILLSFSNNTWTMYVRVENALGGLHPSSSLHPAEDLYPIADGLARESTRSTSGSPASMTGITLGGPALVKQFQVFDPVTAPAGIPAAVLDGTYTANDEMDSYVLMRLADDELQMLSVPVGRGEIGMIELYREGPEGTQYIGEYGYRVKTVWDYGAKSQGGPYTYFIYGFDTDVGFAKITAEPVNPCFWAWTLIEAEHQQYTLSLADNLERYNVLAAYVFMNNVATGAISNNAAPGIAENFTRYPTVMKSPVNYQSGTLTALIGRVTMGDYNDSISLRDAIFALSTSNHDLFLKNRKGDLLKVEIGGAISMQTGDNSVKQEQTAQIPWVEVDSADGAYLTSWEV